MKSRRQELLPRDVLDVVAYWLTVGTVQGIFPCNAVEIRLDDPMRNLVEGGDGFRAHALQQSEHYFTHRDDPAWAVVVDGDCEGDKVRGQQLLDAMIQARKEAH